DADLGVVHVPKPDVEHDVPVPPADHLAGRHPLLFPVGLRVGAENRVVLVLGPFQAVVAGGVTDGVRLVLLAARVPHSVALRWVVVVAVRTHHGGLLPGLFRDEDGLVALALPRLPVLAGGVADPRLAPGLPRVPHLVAVAVPDDDRAVEIVLPIRLVV